ncbi:heavy metal translocating P-type ATPase [bacterium]|nr:heavy metal translocating P-type ATPase [bacterium]
MLENTTSIKCKYCASECDDNLIVINHQSYCCYGCATLDDVVSKLKNQNEDVALKYKQFDHPDLFSKLLDFQNDKLYKISISLPEIHCASCVELLEDLPAFQPLVHRTAVNFETKTCTVWADKALPLSQLAQLLDNLGYPPQISTSKLDAQADKKRHRSMLFKMAFAGFCFGNIMLYSMPHYFGLKALEDPFFNVIFMGLSVALSLPLVVYSGREYLESAYKAAINNKAHIHIPIAIGIVSLWLWSLYEILSGTGHGYLDSLSGLIFFLLVGRWFQSKIYDQVSYKRDLEEFIPLLVRRVSNESEFEWSRISDLRKGDRILVKNNEVIPVDAVLLSREASIDYSFISGEQIPVKVETMDDVFAGGRQLTGQITIGLLDKPDENKLWSAWRSESQKSFESKWTNKVSKYFTWVVLAIAIVSGVIWAVLDPSRALFITSAVLIVACPCALALSAPFTYGNILRVFSRNDFFVKQAEAISTMAATDIVVWDKTGTLTTKNQQGVRYEGKALSPLHNSLIYSVSQQSTHPLSHALVQHLHGVNTVEISNFNEIIGRGLIADSGASSIKLGAPNWLNSNAQIQENASCVAVEIDGDFKGIFYFDQSYREDAPQVINAIGQDYKQALLSGDNASEKHRLEDMYPNWMMMNFNQKPKDKKAAIESLQKNATVSMIGDGMNDSLGLSASNFGIALTDSLNDFYPGADAVLVSEKWTKLPSLFKLAKYSNRILKWSLIFSLSYNIVGLAFAVTGHLTPVVAAILMPVSSITVVAFDALLVRFKAKKLQLI